MKPRTNTPSVAAGEDLTGMERVARNVIVSWGGHLVVMAAGFIMPRMIDRQLGQAQLGIWDFCWTIVSYFQFAGMGIGTSVNRYVARYRAVADTASMNRAVSSVHAIQTAVALAMVSMAAIAAWLLPFLFRERLGAGAPTAGYVVGFLGASLAVQMSCDVYRGVITGCHRWDVHNFINAGSHVLTVVGMITVLILGGTLVQQSICYFAAMVLTEMVRVAMARRVCPEVTVQFSLASRATALKMFSFGGKSFLAQVSPMLLLQTTSVLIATQLGPATLALFARPGSLLRQIQTLLSKSAYILTPTAGSLQSRGEHEEMRRLFLESTRLNVAFTLPIISFMIVFGSEILRVWMGPRYEQGLVMAILAAGYFLPISQQSAYNILVGMDRHGRIGLLTFGITVCGVVFAVAVAHFSTFTLIWAAGIIALCLTLGQGIAFPLQACRALGIQLSQYVRRTLLAPFLANLPLILCLLGAKFFLRNELPVGSILSIGVGYVSLLFIYWHYILPLTLRVRLRKRLSTLFVAARAHDL